MLHLRHSIIHVLKHWLKVGALSLLMFAFALSFAGTSWADTSSPLSIANLPAGNAITNARSLLNYALPIDNPAIRRIQANLESMSLPLKNRRWGAISSTASKVATALRIRRDELLESVPAEKQAEGEAAIAAIADNITRLQTAIEAKDKTEVEAQRATLLDRVGDLEALMVKGFPFEVPEEYRNRPQLKGRATVSMETSKGDITLVLDGYSAPITAGNFADLVQRGFYDGLEFTRAEDYYVVQAGDPPGPEEGFIDPKTKQYRAVPLEILVQGDSEPVYNFTLEEIGRFREHPVLPFSAYGTLGMARPEGEPDGGSSQFFFFLYQAELTPAGVNLLDGRYAAFGYVTNGKEVLRQLKPGDKIVSAKIASGSENLIQPG